MKKLSTITIVLFALCLILSVFSCKAVADLDQDTKKWNGQAVNKNVNTLSITASVGAIDWVCFTTENGVIIKPVSGTTAIAKDDSGVFTFDFAKNTTVEVYIHQPEVVGKDKTEEEKGEFDFRGSVVIGPNEGIEIKDSGYRQVVVPVGYLTLTNDEPLQTSKFEGGDYTVTELWPLEQTGTGTPSTDNPVAFKTIPNKKLIDLNFKNGETTSFLLSAGEYYLAMYQPYRNLNPADHTKYCTNWETLNTDAVAIADTAENLKTYWGKKVTIKAHSEANGDTSSSFGTVKFLDKGDGVYEGRNLSDPIYVDVYAATEGEK